MTVRSMAIFPRRTKVQLLTHLSEMSKLQVFTLQQCPTGSVMDTITAFCRHAAFFWNAAISHKILSTWNGLGAKLAASRFQRSVLKVAHDCDGGLCTVNPVVPFWTAALKKQQWQGIVYGHNLYFVTDPSHFFRFCVFILGCNRQAHAVVCYHHIHNHLRLNLP